MSRILIYPADEEGCGNIRLVWPAQALIAAGHTNVEVSPKRDRRMRLAVDKGSGHVTNVAIDPGIECVVMQRTTHYQMIDAITILRSRGVAVVIDVDDDLAAIDPQNASFNMLRPQPGKPNSWVNLMEACKRATMVTCSTPGLVTRYGGNGRGRVIRNYLAEHYYTEPHVDSDVIGWGAALHSHPRDPSVLGPALARLVDEGAEFRVVGPVEAVGRAFGLRRDPQCCGAVPIAEWTRALTGVGVGICPLVDSGFNARKSWLKPLELSALGIPWVASPRAEYVALHRLGAGVLVDRPKHWYRELRRLVGSQVAREELGAAGRAVADGLRLVDNAWRYLQAWEEAVTIQRQAKALSA